jgi:hypothetical protein
MKRVTFYNKPWGQNPFKYRTLLSFLSKKSWEACAELAFHITNAPEECLSPAQQRMVRAIFKRNKYKGPSLSVGDVVRVTDCKTGETHFLRCDSYGWSFMTIDLDREHFVEEEV